MPFWNYNGTTDIKSPKMLKSCHDNQRRRCFSLCYICEFFYPNIYLNIFVWKWVVQLWKERVFKSNQIFVIRGGIKNWVFLISVKRGGGSRPIQNNLIRKYSDFLTIFDHFLDHFWPFLDIIYQKMMSKAYHRFKAELYYSS